MRKFAKNVKVGGLVTYLKQEYVVKCVHETRNWVELVGLEGSFQRGHVSIKRQG